jgi:dihydrofolate synthase/folylpolyglutamate synthase
LSVLERLKALHPKAIDLSLDRVLRLLGKLGHPERRLPPVVHVAGTNGKGSLIAFLRAITNAMGKSAHVYTSPHLVSFHERIVLADGCGGSPITERHLIDCLRRAELANGGEPITLFEITTVAAFLAFSDVPADLLLLETGMGGRLDATNVVEAPLATVITPISIDHVAFLGDTLAAIAREKAGILKRGIPCIVGPQPPEALEVIGQRAAEIGAPLFVRGRDYEIVQQGDGLFFQSQARGCRLPAPNLLGPHQIENAGTAVAAAGLVFGADLTPQALREGLVSAEWPARLQELGPGALHKFVSEGTRIWLDGGHNPAGAEAIAKALRQWPRPLHLIWGMIESKDAKTVIAALKGQVDHVFTVPIPEEASAFEACELAEMARLSGLRATPTNGVRHALMQSQAAFAAPGQVLICGSLYLAGHVLKLHGARS